MMRKILAIPFHIVGLVIAVVGLAFVVIGDAISGE